MKRPRRTRPVLIALYVNAALLLAIVAVLLSRSGVGPSSAFAAPQPPPIAGGGGLFLMPAQFAVNVWGCYIMDIDSQTLCTYEYSPGQHQLRLTSARLFRYDRGLKRWNTSPNPEEIQHMIEMEKNAVRGRDAQPGDGSAPDAGKPDTDAGPIGAPSTNGNDAPKR